MRTNVFILIMVPAFTLCTAFALSASICWLRHATPEREVVTIESDILDVQTLKSKKWLKYDPNQEYFYQKKIECTTRRGTFPFMVVDTIVIEPNELWYRPIHNRK